MYVQDGCVDVACASTVQCVGLFKSCSTGGGGPFTILSSECGALRAC